MYVLNIKPNYYLEKQNSYYVTKHVEKRWSVHWRFQLDSLKNDQFSNIILFQFVVWTTFNRLKIDVYSLYIS